MMPFTSPPPPRTTSMHRRPFDAHWQRGFHTYTHTPTPPGGTCSLYQPSWTLLRHLPSSTTFRCLPAMMTKQNWWKYTHTLSLSLSLSLFPSHVKTYKSSLEHSSVQSSPWYQSHSSNQNSDVYSLFKATSFFPLFALEVTCCFYSFFYLLNHSQISFQN